MLVHKICTCASNVVHKFQQGRLWSSVRGLVSKETVMQGWWGGGGGGIGNECLILI